MPVHVRTALFGPDHLAAFRAGNRAGPGPVVHARALNWQPFWATVLDGLAVVFYGGLAALLVWAALVKFERVAGRPKRSRRADPRPVSPGKKQTGGRFSFDPRWRPVALTAGSPLSCRGTVSTRSIEANEGRSAMPAGRHSARRSAPDGPERRRRAGGPKPEPMFPFVLPWDDASANAPDVSGWLDRPAGKLGPVVARDGHLFTGTKRLRLVGVNLCFGANFPTHDDAAKVAARLAKFGVNCVGRP